MENWLTGRLSSNVHVLSSIPRILLGSFRPHPVFVDRETLTSSSPCDGSRCEVEAWKFRSEGSGARALCATFLFLLAIRNA